MSLFADICTVRPFAYSPNGPHTVGCVGCLYLERRLCKSGILIWVTSQRDWIHSEMSTYGWFPRFIG